MWLQQTLLECENVEEYDHSRKELNHFLPWKKDNGGLSPECIHAILDLQSKMLTREEKLAGYNRMDRKNCMDAATTSPVEGTNRWIKKYLNITSKRCVDRSLPKIIMSTNECLIRRHNLANRQLTKRNTASRAPTAKYINAHGQALADHNYDSSITLKYAQLDVDSFIVWNFDIVEPSDMDKVHDFSDLRICAC